MAKDTSLNINLGLNANDAKKTINNISNDMEILVNKKNVISVSADTSKAKSQVSELNSSVQAIQDKKIRLELDANATQTDIDKITNQLDLITKDKKKINVDLAKAENDIAKFKDKINNILEKEAKLEINSNDAKIEIDKIQDKINAIQDKKANLLVESNNSNKIIDELQSNLNDLNDKKINITANLNADNFETVVKQVEELDDKEVNIDIKVNTEGFADIGAKFEAVGNIGETFTSIAEKGTELNQSLKEVSAQTGLVGTDLDNLKDRAENAFVNGIGENLAETTKALGNAQNILGKFLEPNQIDDFVVRAGGIAKVFDKDINEVIGGSRTLIAQWGLDGAEAGDLVAYAMQQSGSKMDDTLDTLDEYSQLVKTAGFNAQEFVGVLTVGMQAGARDTDKLADAIKETQIRLNAGDITKSLKDIKSPITNTIADIVKLGESGQISVKDVLSKSANAVKSAFDAGTISASMRDQLNVAISGTMAEDIGGELYTKIFSTPIDTNVINANAKKAGEAMINAISPQTVFDKFEKQAKATWEKVSSAIAPIAKSVGGALTSISQIAPALKLAQEFDFQGLKDGIKNAQNYATAILKMVVPSLFAQSTATASATAAQEGLNTAQSANPMGAIVLAIIAVVGAMYLLYKNVDSVRKVFDSAFAFIKDVIGGVITALSPLGEAFKAIGNFILTLFLAPFKVIYGVIEGVVKSFSDATEKTQTWGQYIAKLKPIFEKISGVISTIYNVFSKLVDFIVNSIVALLVPKVQFLIAVFSELSSFIYDNLVKAFNYVYEKLKPIIGAISDAASAVGGFIDTVIGTSTDKADEAQKKLFASVKTSIQGLDAQKNALFGLKEVNADIIKQKKAELDTQKNQATQLANQIKNEQAKARQLGYINTIYGDATKQLAVLETQIKKTNANVVNTPIDPEAVKKATLENIEYLRQKELNNAQLLEKERERELKTLEINNRFNLRKLELEKASNTVVLTEKEKYEAEKRKIEAKYNLIDVKEREKILADSENNHRETLKTEIEILQDYVNKGIATEQDLTDFRSKQLELRRLENQKQIDDLLKQDTEYNKERAKIEKDVELGKIDTDSAINALQTIAKNRLEILTQNDERIKLILAKNALSYADFEKKVTADTENYLADIKISQIEDRSERERQTSINSAKKTLANDLLLAKNNNDLKLQANLKYISEVTKANQTFARASENTFIKLGRLAIDSLRNAFNNVKAIINQTTQLADPKALKEFSERESELQRQREEGAISYAQYAEEYKKLEQEKADATANATKTSIDWIKTLSANLSTAFGDMISQFSDANARLAQSFTENLDKIETAKKEFGENSTQVKALNDENQEAINDAFINTGAIAGAVFAQMIADGQSATKAFVMTALASLKALLPIITFQIYGKQISELGWWGIPVATALVAVMTGLLSTAEAGIKEMNFANGGKNLFGGFGDGKHSSTKTVVSRVGETGKAEYVFNPTTTQLTGDKVLDEINNRKISVQQWASEKYNGVMDKISNRLDSIENVLKTAKLINSQHAYNIVATNNVVQSVKSIDMFTR